MIKGAITTHNKKINHKFKEGVADLLRSQNHRKSFDFITVAQAQEKTLIYTGRTVSHSTAARWIVLNGLGYKLPGNGGQWIVDSLLFVIFLENIEQNVQKYVDKTLDC